MLLSGWESVDGRRTYSDVEMYPWNPWHGCHKVSEGCENCYMFAGNESRGITDSDVVKLSSTKYTAIVDRKKDGTYKIPPGTVVMTAMTGDFFVEEADLWREKAWKMISQRKDLTFMVLTKRPERVEKCLPDNWGSGYPNVWLCVSAENQKRCEERIPILSSVDCARRCAFVSPMLSEVKISDMISDGRIHDVMCGGEYGKGCRPCRYEWVTSLRDQCVEAGVNFHWHNSGEIFIKDGKEYRLGIGEQMAVCRSAGLDNIVIPLPDPIRKSIQSTLF